MKDEVDPSRFTGKRFTRRKTWPNTPDDYVAIIDGLVAGRILKRRSEAQGEYWFWTMNGPYFPGPPTHGEKPTLEAAQDAFKLLFWKWHAWALKQPGKATWYGADE